MSFVLSDWNVHGILDLVEVRISSNIVISLVLATLVLPHLFIVGIRGIRYWVAVLVHGGLEVLDWRPLLTGVSSSRNPGLS